MLDLASQDASKCLVEHVSTSCLSDVDVEVIDEHLRLDDVEHLEVLGWLQELAQARGAMWVLIVVHLCLEFDGDTLFL